MRRAARRGLVVLPLAGLSGVAARSCFEGGDRQRPKAHPPMPCRRCGRLCFVRGATIPIGPILALREQRRHACVLWALFLTWRSQWPPSQI